MDGLQLSSGNRGVLNGAWGVWVKNGADTLIRNLNAQTRMVRDVAVQGLQPGTVIVNSELSCFFRNFAVALGGKHGLGTETAWSVNPTCARTLVKDSVTGSANIGQAALAADGWVTGDSVSVAQPKRLAGCNKHAAYGCCCLQALVSTWLCRPWLLAPTACCSATSMWATAAGLGVRWPQCSRPRAS